MNNPGHFTKARRLLAWLCAALCLFVAVPADAKSPSRYLYNLASFDGLVPSIWARLTVDAKTGEVYTLNRSKGLIEVFNQNAMLIYAFGEGIGLGDVIDFSAGENGELFLLSGVVGTQGVLHLDYRGDLVARLGLEAIPEEFLPLRARRLEFRDNKLYLLDTETLKVVVLSTRGDFLTGYDVREHLATLTDGSEEDAKWLAGVDFNGFCVDRQGSMYFTAPTAFAAFRLDTDGSIRSFGSSGSGPGRFGIVAGIDVDSHGNIYVTDRLRSMVIAFDRDFRFLYEFGGRGPNPRNLIAPDDVAIDEQHDRLYVSQAANRGVSVFRLKQK